METTKNININGMSMNNMHKAIKSTNTNSMPMNTNNMQMNSTNMNININVYKGMNTTMHTHTNDGILEGTQGTTNHRQR